MQDRNFQPDAIHSPSSNRSSAYPSTLPEWKHLIEIPTFRGEVARRDAELFHAERRTNYVSSVRVTCNIQIILGERRRLMRMYANNAHQRWCPSWRASMHLSAMHARARAWLYDDCLARLITRCHQCSRFIVRSG